MGTGTSLPYAARRKNLQRIVKETFEGNVAACARALARSEAYVWQLINSYRPMGERITRYIEERLDLIPGTLDADPKKAFQVTTQLRAQLGGTLTKNFVLCPMVKWEDVRKRLRGDKGKKHSTLTTDDVRPCPVSCSESTFVLLVTGDAMAPRVPHGYHVFVDPAMLDLVHERLYLVDHRDWATPRLRQAEQMDGEWWFVTTGARTERASQVEGVKVFGTVCYIGHDAF